MYFDNDVFEKFFENSFDVDEIKINVQSLFNIIIENDEFLEKKIDN